MLDAPQLTLASINRVFVKQVPELAEWFGFETRNKYHFMDESQNPIAYAAEQQKGFFGFIFRQFLGHWRNFDVHFFTADRKLFMIGNHPFRWVFSRIELRDHGGQCMGAIQKRFSILSKRFDVENSNGEIIMQVDSPIWRIWTFTFTRMGRKVAEIQKKWSGIITEVFTDRDNFLVEFSDLNMNERDRKVVMAAAIFIDLLYFERKAGNQNNLITNILD